MENRLKTNQTSIKLTHLEDLKWIKTQLFSSQKFICSKLDPKYSFDTPKFFVRIS